MNSSERIASLWNNPLLPLNRPGFMLPEILGFEWHQIGPSKGDNWVVTPPEAKWQQKIKVEVRQEDTGNVIVLGNNTNLSGKCVVWGSKNTVIFGDRVSGNLNCYSAGEATITFVGAETTIVQASLFNQRVNTVVAIGERCMLSHGITIRSYDDHAVIDLDTGAHLNCAQDIIIGPYVWLCPEVQVLKGVKVGYGSIVGTRSLVLADLGRCVLAAGVPARVLRERVSWDRAPTPKIGIHKEIARDWDLFL